VRVAGAIVPLLFMALPINGCSVDPVTRPVHLSETVADGERHMGVRLLGAIEIHGGVGTERPVGLSGLAWDEDETRLYAVSDLGWVWQFEPRFESGRLVDLRVHGRSRLRDPDGSPLVKPKGDAEGLAARNASNGIRGDTELWISYEHRPRVQVHSPDGTWQRSVDIPQVLRSPDSYRHPNHALEAIALTPGHDGMMLMPEAPLRDEPEEVVPLFSPDSPPRTYPLYPAPGSSVTAMEVFPDGRILVLERAFVSPLAPFQIILRWVDPDQGQTGPLAPETVAVFDSADGWAIDNFEGLTRHRGQRVLLVSDDNNRRTQRTLLLYLELLPQ
jgi:hypothetical protein